MYIKRSTKRSTTQEFIEKAHIIHNNKYDYSHSVYVNNKTKVTICCHEHGLFKQKPNSHLLGMGCHKCAGNSKLTTGEFIAKAKTVHGEKYGYAFSVYQKSCIKLFIYCPEHGMFEQTPNRHLMGAGCNKCGVNRTSQSKLLSTEVFVDRANELHNNKYDYSMTSYSTNYLKVKIVCKEHGVFLQTPNNHMMGNGCPGCAETGFDQTKTSFIYLLRSECGRYAKIGITNKPSQRHAQLRRKTPFLFHVVECIEGVGSWVSDVETDILNSFDPACFNDVFDGSTEWVLWSEGLRLTLLKLMNQGRHYVQKDTESTTC